MSTCAAGNSLVGSPDAHHIGNEDVSTSSGGDASIHGSGDLYNNDNYNADDGAVTRQLVSSEAGNRVDPGLRGSRRGKPNSTWTLLNTFDTFDDADKFRKARDFKVSATGQSKSATGVAKVYSCKSHKNCPVRLRIKPQRVVLEGKVCTSFMCQLSGDHILEDEVASSRGISGVE
ncbi:hypothetical protein PR003_g10003 [Phytophthora rubi]|uniref:Uncharacterized protein n=1 Tax=Phytophthora rubi TaxID=129364 RepID=A0A6A3MJV8_9STRA|nr:hypothetical protein PR002_g9973 [Phytophthora rubi]KAE9035030.1 hypothetical protein PR001_g9480 [Phytophthora rubi]KAE9341408.1 hypothetical protein PR003_g10003 [Phytophthora rubi]